jgi:hypothetical protein
MSILSKARPGLEKTRKKALVTEMLSFSKIGGKCCDANFFHVFRISLSYCINGTLGEKWKSYKNKINLKFK